MKTKHLSQRKLTAMKNVLRDGTVTSYFAETIKPSMELMKSMFAFLQVQNQGGKSYRHHHRVQILRISGTAQRVSLSILRKGLFGIRTFLLIACSTNLLAQNREGLKCSL